MLFFFQAEDGIRDQAALANASFHVRVTYNTRWKEMGEGEKRAIRESLDLNWGPAGQLDYGGGTTHPQRTRLPGSHERVLPNLRAPLERTHCNLESPPA